MDLITLPKAYELYFQNIYSRHDSFMGAFFRDGKEKIKRVKIDGIYYISKKHIERYFKRKDLKELKKFKYLELLEEISLNNKLSIAARLIGIKPVIMYHYVYFNRMTEKTIKTIRKHKKELTELVAA